MRAEKPVIRLQFDHVGRVPSGEPQPSKKTPRWFSPLPFAHGLLLIMLLFISVAVVVHVFPVDGTEHVVVRDPFVPIHPEC
jgi:hypothetical protein